MSLDDLTWLDVLLLLLLIWRVKAAASKRLGDSLSELFALLLLVGLFLGFRMAGELRELLGDLAQGVDWQTGIGGKLLIVLLAWVLLQVLRRRLGYWLEALVPELFQGPVTLLSEVVRTVLQVWILVWLLGAWYGDEVNKPEEQVPMVVRMLN